MTKKDYIAIAKVISDERNHPASGSKAAQVTCDRLAHRFADMLASDNPRFDRARFLQACGASD